jgi:ribosomal protein S18 acetylase RimI-like enzyme
LTAIIRPAMLAEAEQLVELIRSAYRGEASRSGWTSEADLVAGDRTDAENVRAIIDGSHSMMLVLSEGNDIIACCQLERHSDNVAYFGTFAVRPTAQGAGRGRLLITEAEQQAVLKYGSSVIEMTVLAQQEKLIAWYERLGYSRTGETRQFPADLIYARPLQEGLYFIVLTKELAGSPHVDCMARS